MNNEQSVKIYNMVATSKLDKSDWNWTSRNGMDSAGKEGEGGDRGVATEWIWVDMSTPLLPEVVPEIDANPVSFLRGVGRLGLELDSPVGR